MATIQGFDEAAASALFEAAGQKKIMLGCQFASLVIDTFLAGILTMQMHKYFTMQGDDKKWTKAIVVWTAIMNTIVTCYYWAYLSYLFCDKYGEWLPWLEVRWLMMMPTFDVMCVAVVQGFFAYRAFLLMKRNYFILAIISMLIVAAVCGAVGVTIVFGAQESLLGADKVGAVLITWTSTTTAADVLIAGCILYGLRRSKSGWAHTDRLITRLVRLTFEAQLPPTFLAIAYLAEWCVQPSSLLGALFQASLPKYVTRVSTDRQAIQCKAYTVGLLFSLNSRIELVAKTKTGETVGAMPAQVYGMSSRTTRQGGQLEINMEVETDTYITGYDTQPKRLDSLSDIEEGHVKHEVPYNNVSTTRLTHPDAVMH